MRLVTLMHTYAVAITITMHHNYQLHARCKLCFVIIEARKCLRMSICVKWSGTHACWARITTPSSVCIYCHDSQFFWELQHAESSRWASARLRTSPSTPSPTSLSWCSESSSVPPSPGSSLRTLAPSSPVDSSSHRVLEDIVYYYMDISLSTVAVSLFFIDSALSFHLLISFSSTNLDN